MDLNTMATFRSLLLGVVNNKSSLLQNEDVTCFYQHASSSSNSSRSSRNNSCQSLTSLSTDLKSSTINNNNNIIDNGHDHNHHQEHQTDIPPKNVNVSRLKSVNIDYLSVHNFSFHPCKLNGFNKNDDSDSDGRSKSLVVLFAWLFAKERHLDKYRTLYMEHGFDVLTIKVNVRDFIIPSVGSKVIAANFVQFLNEHADHYHSMIFHAFSVGAYQMGEVFVMLNEEFNKQAKSTARRLLKGLVYDSAADINEAPIGLSKATTSNRWLQWAICSLMYVHMRCCYYLATRHYIASSQVIHKNEFNCPVLVFLSKDDEVVNYVDQFETTKKWREQGIDVTMKCWEQSPHVSHFFKHPDEYRTSVNEFINKVVILEQKTRRREKMVTDN